jgi:hypothetical protein
MNEYNIIPIGNKLFVINFLKVKLAVLKLWYTYH